MNIQNTKCANTPDCWACAAPFRIEFVLGADTSRFAREYGLVPEQKNTFRVTAGMIRQGYQTAHLSLHLFRRNEPIPIPHAHILRVADIYGATIWENAELKEKTS